VIPDGGSGRAEQIQGCFTGGIFIVWWLATWVLDAHNGHKFGAVLARLLHGMARNLL